MQAPKNVVRFDYADNPQLAALFANWKVGDRYTMEIEFQLNSVDKDGASGSLLEVTHDPDEPGQTATEIEPDGAEPVMLTIGGGRPAEPAGGSEGETPGSVVSIEELPSSKNERSLSGSDTFGRGKSVASY